MNVEEWSRIRALHDSGMAIKAVARHLGLSRNTVRRALSLDEPPEDGRRGRPAVADDYERRIAEILARDPDATATAIATEIEWSRSMTALRERVRELRPGGLVDRPATTDNRLPADVTSFVGRRHELGAIRSLLGTTRLLTLTGCGGIGKTRLAVKAAEQTRRAFADGILYVELAGLRDPALLAQTFVDQLGLGHHDGPVSTPETVLADYLRTRHTLLVVDNCEHLVEGCCTLLGQLLVLAPDLRILATSRQALGPAGEHLFVVPPLAIPGARRGGDEDDPAVALFAARAAAVVPGFRVTDANDAAVRRLCEQLDGVPLGIELAAIQLRALSVEDLADHLAQRLLVLRASGAGTARHRSLDAAMDWSYDLCSGTERLVWARASVFVGGFELAACELVGGDADLGHCAILEAVRGLVDKSILQREDHDGQVRFRMLEPIRESGRARLADVELQACRRRHLGWCVGLIGELAQGWFGPAQEEWYRRIRAEQANLRTALDFALGEEGDIRSAERIVGDSWLLWAILSLKEHRHWLERVGALSTGVSSERVQALATLGMVLTLQGDRDTARVLVAQGEAMAETLEDPSLLAYTQHVRGLADFFGGDFDGSRELLLDALATYEQAGAAPDLVGALRVHLGLVGVFDGHLDWAERQLRWILARSQECGEQWVAAYAMSGIGFVDLTRGKVDEAADQAAASLAILSRFRDATGVSLSLELLAWAEAARDHHERSAVLLGAASGMWHSFGEQLYGSPDWVAQRAGFERQARAGLGRAEFAAAFRRGGDLSREELLGYALHLPEPLAQHEAPAPRAGLTAREHEIAGLVAAGLTNKQIASQLVVSPRTVEGHVGHTLRKLGFERRAQLAAWAADAHDPGSKYGVARGQPLR